MNQLPKFVTERLAKPGERSLVHPDADLLTAFVEQKVTRNEREQVFAHLSQCSICREVVALATPELIAASATPTSATGVRTWLRWPWMRWAALATACMVVAAIGISLRPTLSDRGTQKATEIVRQEERNAARPLADKAASEESLNAAHATDSKKESAPAAQARKPVFEGPNARNDGMAERAAAGGTRSRDIAGPAKPASGKDDAQVAALADEKKRSSKLSQTVEVTAQNAAVPAAGSRTFDRLSTGPAPAPAHNDGDQVSQNRSLDASTSPQQDKFLIQPQQAQTQGLAKQQPAYTFKANVPPPGPPPPPPAANSAAPSSSVNVTTAEVAAEQDSRGKNEVGALTLERGKRPGKTKGMLPNLGFGGGLYNTAASPTLKSSVGRAPSWKISPEGKLLRKKGGEDSWHEIELPSAATLHSLASNNLDAWVGGAPLSGESSGALFHTTDGGEHWQRVNGPWTGDILALQASGAQHTSVLVRTAGGEWQTQDGGMNWIRTR
jgi:hypothetical protein